MSSVTDTHLLGGTRERVSLPPLTGLAEIHEARAGMPACVHKTPIVALSRDFSQTEAMWLAEPAGAVAAAAWLAGKVDQNLKTVALVSGGNLTPATMQRLFALAEELS